MPKNVTDDTFSKLMSLRYEVGDLAKFLLEVTREAAEGNLESTIKAIDTAKDQVYKRVIPKALALDIAKSQVVQKQMEDLKAKGGL